MVVKKKSSTPKPARSPKNKAPPAPQAEPPEHLDEALAEVEQLLVQQGNEKEAGAAPTHSLPAVSRSCLDVLSARENQPKRFATLAVEIPDSLVDAHAKSMAKKCPKCADLLRVKYALLEENRLGTKLASETAEDDLLLALLMCMRKSPRLLWVQPQQQSHSAHCDVPLRPRRARAL